jgi:hypothetical protein
MKEKMGFISWLQDLFRDERGSTSIKPVVGLICALTLCVILFINCYKSDLKLEDVIVNAVLLLAIVGIGADTVDKFSIKGLTKGADTKDTTTSGTTTSDTTTTE